MPVFGRYIMGYQLILEQIKEEIGHEIFSLYLDNMVEKMIQNNHFEQDTDNIYGFYISEEENASISINNMKNLEFCCEQKRGNFIASIRVVLSHYENNIFSLQYYKKMVDNEWYPKYSVFETLIFNENQSLIHAHYEEDGQNTTIATSDLDNYFSFFSRENFCMYRKKF